MLTQVSPKLKTYISSEYGGIYVEFMLPDRVLQPDHSHITPDGRLAQAVRVKIQLVIHNVHKMLQMHKNRKNTVKNLHTCFILNKSGHYVFEMSNKTKTIAHPVNNVENLQRFPHFTQSIEGLGTLNHVPETLHITKVLGSFHALL